MRNKMNKKIIGILISMLMIASSVIIVTAEFSMDNEKQVFRNFENYYPDDFELLIESGGFGPWTELLQLYVKKSGEAYYSITYCEDRDTGNWNLIEEFEFTQSEMDQIWNEIVENNFFDLNEFYSEEVADGTFAYMKITANGETHEVTTENKEVVQFDNIVKKINEFTPGNLDLFYNAIYNDAPRKPTKPSGSSSGKPKIEYTYTSSTIDFEGEKIFYLFDWGDGSNSGWVGPYDSGDFASVKHKWKSKSDYMIKVKAKDDPNGDGNHSDGKESRWSDPLAVSISKNKHFSNSLLELLFQKVFYWLLLLKQTKISVENVSSSELTFETLGFESSLLYVDSGTEVTIEGCNITISLKIEIYGEGATDELAGDIEWEIKTTWGKDKDAMDWWMDCKEKDKICPLLEPGCKVKFDVDVKKRNSTDAPSSGCHQINVSNDTSTDGNGRYSSVNMPLPTPNGGIGTGNWDNNEPYGTWAHEAGHLMGLPDLYTEWKDENGTRHTKPKKSEYDDHIMGNLSGYPTANNITEIVNAGGVYCPCDCCPPEEDTEEPNTKIQTPQDNQQVSNPIIVGGYADDGPDGSGVVLLDYLLQWNGGNHDGSDYLIDPPNRFVSFNIGPIDLSNYIQPGDWISITVFATDAAGNTGSDAVFVTWEEEVDNTPPVTIKTIGLPQAEDGYVIWPITPITLTATDDMSGVNHIHYDIWWDSNGDLILDTHAASKNVYSSSTTFTVESYGILFGLIQLKWYAVDNAYNQEETHIQDHMVMEG